MTTTGSDGEPPSYREHNPSSTTGRTSDSYRPPELNRADILCIGVRAAICPCAPVLTSIQGESKDLSTDVVESARTIRQVTCATRCLAVTGTSAVLLCCGAPPGMAICCNATGLALEGANSWGAGTDLLNVLNPSRSPASVRPMPAESSRSSAPVRQMPSRVEVYRVGAEVRSGPGAAKAM